MEAARASRFGAVHRPKRGARLEYLIHTLARSDKARRAPWVGLLGRGEEERIRGAQRAGPERTADGPFNAPAAFVRDLAAVILHDHSRRRGQRAAERPRLGGRIEAVHVDDVGT